MSLSQDVLFADFKTNLTPSPVSGDLVRLTNLDAIKTSVKNLVLTQKYERPFKPLVGSNVTNYLFENFTPLTEEGIRDSIVEVIENYEPRAALLDVRVTADIDRNGFEVTIIFRGVNSIEPTELDIFLEQIR